MRGVWGEDPPQPHTYTHIMIPSIRAPITAPMDGRDPASSQSPTLPRSHHAVQVTARPATHVPDSQQTPSPPTPTAKAYDRPSLRPPLATDHPQQHQRAIRDST